MLVFIEEKDKNLKNATVENSMYIVDTLNAAIGAVVHMLYTPILLIPYRGQKYEQLNGELGIDYGALRREYFRLLVPAIINDRGLLRETQSNGYAIETLMN